MNRNFALILLLVPSILLTGCSERIQAEIEAGKIRRAEIAAQRDKEIAEARGRHERMMAEQKQAHERKMQQRFYAFAGPVLRFFIVAGVIFASVSLFQWLGARHADYRANLAYNIQMEQIRQAAAERKYQLALVQVFGENGTGGVFDRLSDEQKTLILKRIEPPKVEKDQWTPDEEQAA